MVSLTAVYSALQAYHNLDKRPRIFAHSLNVRLNIHVEPSIETHALCLSDSSGSQTKVPETTKYMCGHTNTQRQQLLGSLRTGVYLKVVGTNSLLVLPIFTTAPLMAVRQEHLKRNICISQHKCRHSSSNALRLRNHARII